MASVFEEKKEYIHGPISVTKIVSKSKKSIVYILGDEHNKLSTDVSDKSISIENFIKAFVKTNKLENVDINVFLEISPDDNKKITQKDMYLDSYIIDLHNTLIGLPETDKLCLKLYSSDPRTKLTLYEKFRDIFYLDISELSLIQLKIHCKNIADDMKLMFTTRLNFLTELKQNIMQTKLNNEFENFNIESQLFLYQYYCAILHYSDFFKTQIKDKFERINIGSEQDQLMTAIEIINNYRVIYLQDTILFMDLQLISNLLKNTGNTNINIIYVGDAHAEHYRNILTNFGFNLVHYVKSENKIIHNKYYMKNNVRDEMEFNMNENNLVEMQNVMKDPELTLKNIRKNKSNNNFESYNKLLSQYHNIEKTKAEQLMIQFSGHISQAIITIVNEYGLDVDTLKQLWDMKNTNKDDVLESYIEVETSKLEKINQSLDENEIEYQILLVTQSELHSKKIKSSKMESIISQKKIEMTRLPKNTLEYKALLDEISEMNLEKDSLRQEYVTNIDKINNSIKELTIKKSNLNKSLQFVNERIGVLREQNHKVMNAYTIKALCESFIELCGELHESIISDIRLYLNIINNLIEKRSIINGIKVFSSILNPLNNIYNVDESLFLNNIYSTFNFIGFIKEKNIYLNSNQHYISYQNAKGSFDVSAYKVNLLTDSELKEMTTEKRLESLEKNESLIFPNLKHLTRNISYAFANNLLTSVSNDKIQIMINPVKAEYLYNLKDNNELFKNIYDISNFDDSKELEEITVLNKNKFKQFFESLIPNINLDIEKNIIYTLYSFFNVSFNSTENCVNGLNINYKEDSEFSIEKIRSYVDSMIESIFKFEYNPDEDLKSNITNIRNKLGFFTDKRKHYYAMKKYIIPRVMILTTFFQ